MKQNTGEGIVSLSCCFKHIKFESCCVISSWTFANNTTRLHNDLAGFITDFLNTDKDFRYFF